MALDLKFPPLQKLLIKSVEEVEPDDAKLGVCIFNEHAIIVMEQGLLFFNLSDYFIQTKNIDQKEGLEELSSILEFMENKMFSPMFWEELTKGGYMTLSPEGLNIEGSIKKDIYYDDKFFDNTEIKMMCKGLLNSSNHGKVVNAINVKPLFDVMNQLKTLVKNDTIVLRTVGESTPVHFTFDENPWIYGMITPEPSVQSKQFMFDALEEFCKTVD